MFESVCEDHIVREHCVRQQTLTSFSQGCPLEWLGHSESGQNSLSLWLDIVADRQKRSLITTSRGRQRSFTHLSLFFFHVVFFSSSLTVCFSCFAPPPNSLFHSSVFTSFYYSFVFFFFSVFILFPPHVHFFSLHFPLSLTHHLLHFCSFALSPWSSFW